MGSVLVSPVRNRSESLLTPSTRIMKEHEHDWYKSVDEQYWLDLFGFKFFPAFYCKWKCGEYCCKIVKEQRGAGYSPDKPPK